MPLVFTRRSEQTVTITIDDLRRSRAKLSFRAPESFVILRGELLDSEPEEPCQP